MADFIEKCSVYRYERKFTVQAVHASEVFFQVKSHPVLFREIFEQRQVNNIYLDTPGLLFYTENKLGISDRKKARIRWYGGPWGGVASPKLEYKIKSGLLGTKLVFPLAPFAVDEYLTVKKLQAVFKNSNLPPAVAEDLKNLRPTLLNTYHRHYFRSADGQFRLTLDQGLCFYRVGSLRQNFMEKRLKERHFVLELKYAADLDERASDITSHFPFRLDKSSKYVTGIDLLHIRRGG